MVRSFVSYAVAYSLALCLPWHIALAADPSSLIPPTRWIFLDATLTARTPEACNALAKEFAEEIAKLNQQHEACLQGSPQEPAGSEGCSKESCQFLHTTRDKATKKASEQNRICTGRVNEYLAEERAKAQRKQKEADEAELKKQAQAAALVKQDKQERERAQEHARITAQKQATRDKEDKARHDQQVADKLTKETQTAAQLAAQKEASEREAKRAQQEADLAAPKLANVAVQNQQDQLAKSPAGGTQNKPTANPFPKRRKGTAAGGTDGNGADRSEKNPFDKTASQGSSSATSTSSGPGTDGVRKGLEKNVSPGATTATAANPFEKSASTRQETPAKNQALIERKAKSAFKNLQRALSSEAEFRTEQKRIVDVASAGNDSAARDRAVKNAKHVVEMRDQYYDWVVAGGNTPAALRKQAEKEDMSLEKFKESHETAEAAKEVFEHVKELGKLIAKQEWGAVALSAGKKTLGNVVSWLDYSPTYSVDSMHSYCDDRVNECEAIRVRAEQNRGLMQAYRSEYQEFERSYFQDLGGGDEVKGRVLAEQQQRRSNNVPVLRNP